MLRLQLDPRDVARLTVRPTLGPIGESLLSLEVLRGRRPSPLTAAWEHAVRPEVAGWVGPLLALDTSELLAEVRWDRAVPPLPRIVDGGDDGGGRGGRPGSLARFRRYHDVAVRPYWPSIQAYVEAERARRARIMAGQGVGHLLATLHPRVRWRPPFLDVDDGLHGRSPHRRGPDVRGRTSVSLVPSVFCLDRPLVLPASPTSGEQGSTCLVVYPALRSLDDATSLWAGEVPGHRRALASLLGRTRARALDAITDTCSTTELARRIGVSPATASHHVDVLRRASLVVSHRLGNATSHRLTALGAALLDPDGRSRHTAAGAEPSTPALSTAVREGRQIRLPARCCS